MQFQDEVSEAVTTGRKILRADSKPAKERTQGKSKKDLDKELDRALEESFPASDPPAPAQPTGTEPAGDPAATD